MSSPFVFNVAHVLRETMPETRHQSGPSPSRIGAEMIAIEKGEPVSVDATITPLGGGLLIDAEVAATLTGQCVRCLRELRPEVSLHVSQVYSADPDFITGDTDDADEIPQIVRDEVDIEQCVIDEAGLNLPFNPVCEPKCPDETDTPVPDGVSGENSIDPRWAGLEKFL